MPWIHGVLGLLMFVLGAAVGSFLNVCIYRIPWEKSLIWPGSRCPKCLEALSARDNVPIFGWIALGGKCRYCGLPISIRYPLVELLVGLLFAAVYTVDIAMAPRNPFVWGNFATVAQVGYHLILVSLLVVAAFIDMDLTIIPDAVTIPGMLLGVGLGALIPGVRPEPAQAETAWGGLVVGLTGLAVGAGLVAVVRLLGTLAFRREAMGVGDITLLALIGSFLGWQAAILTFFLAPFFGLAQALWKGLRILGKRLTGRQSSTAEHELPFGPYLSMAAVVLLIGWPWIWAGWARGNFDTLAFLVSDLWTLTGSPAGQPVRR